MVNASAVLGHQGILAGYQLAFDTGKSKLTKNNFSLGYSTGDFVMHANVNDEKFLEGPSTRRSTLPWRQPSI